MMASGCQRRAFMCSPPSGQSSPDPEDLCGSAPQQHSTRPALGACRGFPDTVSVRIGGLAGCSLLSHDRALWALRTWLDSCDLQRTSEGDQW
jgi:hypothetical protein